MLTPEPLSVRRTRDVRLIEKEGRVVAYPEPHHTPILPAGWAPLSREQQDAVLSACDAAAPEAMMFRLGALCEPDAEYRVYRLASELWGGLSIVSRAICQSNKQLLGLAWDTRQAVAVAVDFFNWDLQTHGQGWRLDVRPASAEHS
jgi:hypothetical protein